MTDFTNYVNLTPSEIIPICENHIRKIEERRNKAKESWFENKSKEVKTFGFFFKTNRHYTHKEMNDIWTGENGFDYFYSPLYDMYDSWNRTINRFKNILFLCNVANERGEKVLMSQVDINFVFGFNIENYE